MKYIHLKTGNIYRLYAIALVEPYSANAAVYHPDAECDLGTSFLAKNTEFNHNEPDAHPEYFSDVELFRVITEGDATVAIPITQFESLNQVEEFDARWKEQPLPVWLREHGFFTQKFAPNSKAEV